MRYLALVAALLLAGSAAAIEPPKQDKPPESKEIPPTAPTAPAESPPMPAGAPAAKPEEKVEEEETLPPLPADATPGPSPTRFNPTEKVRADFPVSFPIDI